MARLLQHPQTFKKSCQLHAVIRGVRLGSVQLALVIADGRTYVDGREIYLANDLRVGLFTSTESF